MLGGVLLPVGPGCRLDRPGPVGPAAAFFVRQGRGQGGLLGGGNGRALLFALTAGLLGGALLVPLPLFLGLGLPLGLDLGPGAGRRGASSRAVASMITSESKGLGL